MQEGHLEGGIEEETGLGSGVVPVTGSSEGQLMDACLVEQNVQCVGFDRLTTRHLPDCELFSVGVEGIQIGSQVLTLFRRFCLSDV